MTGNAAAPQGPDGICSEFAESTSKISIRMLDRETVLIESDKVGLEFLSRLLSAVALANDDGFQLSPSGPGSALFSDQSNIGLYIHRTE